MKYGAWRLLCAALVVAVGLAVGGCVHVDVDVALHDNDFGATITERLRVTRTLKKMCGGPEDTKAVMSHLSREAAAQRVTNMGKGAALKSHKTRDLPDGSTESVAVYTIPHINHLQIANPYLHHHPQSVYRFGVWVDTNKKQKNGRRNGHYGLVWIVMKRVEEVRLPKGVVSRTSVPAQQQLYRELRPVFADMASDLNIQFTFTVPTRFVAQYYEKAIRGVRRGPKTLTLVSVSGKDMDMSGQGFFENEEIMIKLLQMDLDNSLIQRHAANFPNNHKTPVLRSGRHQGQFSFYPTQFLIDKYLGGKRP